MGCIADATKLKTFIKTAKYHAIAKYQATAIYQAIAKYQAMALMIPETNGGSVVRTQ